MYNGVQIVEILPKEGVWGLRNRNFIPLGSLISLRNATLEDNTWRTGGGAAKLGTVPVASKGLVAVDFWPDSTTQRTLVNFADGSIRKDNGSGGGWSTLLSGLTTSGQVPMWVLAGAEQVGRNRKAIFFDGVNWPQVVSGDAAGTTALSKPPADWLGANQPGFGVVHDGFLWAGGNLNNPGTIYRSQKLDHEDFLTFPFSLPILSGKGERLTAGLSYKGLLILWGIPDGVYALDTRDPSEANWRWAQVGRAGCPGPLLIARFEDDVVWVDPAGGWHLLSATQATGSVRASDLTYRKLGSKFRTEIATSLLPTAQLIYYEDKGVLMLGCHGLGGTAKSRCVHMDVNRRGDLGERWVFWDRDNNEALFLRKGSDLVQRPAMVDDVGQVWNLDQSSRDKAGAGYAFEWFMADTDLSEILPGVAGRWKNLRFVQVEYDGRTGASHVVTPYLDGKAKAPVTLSLVGSGTTLPATLPFTLSTDALTVGSRRRLYGRCKRFALRGQSSNPDEDVSITKILVGVESGE